jgi:hypothetical protein
MSDYPEGGFYHRQLKEILGIPLGVRKIQGFSQILQLFVIIQDFG